MFGIDGSVLILFPFILLFYFLPAIIASYRKHSKAAAIGVLNLLAGWTFIGWVIAAVWAFTENNRGDNKEKSS